MKNEMRKTTEAHMQCKKERKIEFVPARVWKAIENYKRAP